MPKIIWCNKVWYLPRKNDDSYWAIIPRIIECVNKFLNCQRPERISPLWPIDRNLQENRKAEDHESWSKWTKCKARWKADLCYAFANGLLVDNVGELKLLAALIAGDFPDSFVSRNRTVYPMVAIVHWRVAQPDGTAVGRQMNRNEMVGYGGQSSSRGVHVLLCHLCHCKELFADSVVLEVYASKRDELKRIGKT